jgi:hypothetical protein
VPVGSTEARTALAGEADEVVCPSRPEPFIAIGLHYLDFEQVDDSEVVALLQGGGQSWPWISIRRHWTADRLRGAAGEADCDHRQRRGAGHRESAAPAMSLAPLLADVVSRLHGDRSLSDLIVHA